jgi:L-seryl-tRNA(Ser) seleniumtransferase
MNGLLRSIPKVDDILKHDAWKDLIGKHPEEISKDALREYLDALRSSVKEGKIKAIPSIEELVKGAELGVIALMSPGLKRVINGTGVIIHTNLGRSVLAKQAIEAITRAASHYTNLEYDLQRGSRGDRYEHCTSIVKRLTGAEGALVVNNNAGAVFLVLNTLAEGREVIVSRGELVEIGGTFRIPDVMKKSGAVLREVGTTNRTYREDYEYAISESTGLLMKAHTSNYRIKGFVHETAVEDLIDLGKRHNLPTYYDAGSGLLQPLKGMGINDEPCVADQIRKGWDVISMSGDKLLGGPQAGIIVGEKSYIDALRKNPMTRALRPDKFTLAGLESTLLLYLDESVARAEIPTLRMMHEEGTVLKKRAEQLTKRLKKVSGNLSATTVKLSSEVGGGSLPDVLIPSFGISIQPLAMSVETLEERLRNIEIPIIGRIEKRRLLLDMRTILKEDELPLVKGIEKALSL